MLKRLFGNNSAQNALKENIKYQTLKSEQKLVNLRTLKRRMVTLNPSSNKQPTMNRMQNLVQYRRNLMQLRKIEEARLAKRSRYFTHPLFRYIGKIFSPRLQSLKREAQILMKSRIF